MRSRENNFQKKNCWQTVNMIKYLTSYLILLFIISIVKTLSKRLIKFVIYSSFGFQIFFLAKRMWDVRETFVSWKSTMTQLLLQEYDRHTHDIIHHANEVYALRSDALFNPRARTRAVTHWCAVRHTATSKHQTCVLITTSGCCLMYIVWLRQNGR